ncbi:hypothetical protein EXIGLDRAFT_241770 [Exidia glandulosa HHB12029]|uniref:Uncharacterized protein n=1 Tax=Exidia glandulosa HHB12029 TaxID=1314781 RepID=A0A165Q767_EXIGL|nr:hypothetical protein EXIGLDRAFT_241770 [Exidia glandulosa HHB12029]
MACLCLARSVRHDKGPGPIALPSLRGRERALHNPFTSRRTSYVLVDALARADPNFASRVADDAARCHMRLPRIAFTATTLLLGITFVGLKPVRCQVSARLHTTTRHIQS